MNIQEYKQLEHQAEAGKVDSMFKLAKLYRFGKTYNSLSIPKNSEKAKELLRAAAAEGHKPSSTLLDRFDKKNVFNKIGHYLGNILDRFDTFITRLGEFIASTFAWLIGLTVLGVIVVLLVKGIAALPVSIAIIIGAIIIAMAIRK